MLFAVTCSRSIAFVFVDVECDVTSCVVMKRIFLQASNNSSATISRSTNRTTSTIEMFCLVALTESCVMPRGKILKLSYKLTAPLKRGFGKRSRLILLVDFACRF